MKIISTLIAFLLLSSAAVPAEKPAAPLPWQRYDAGLEQAHASRKPVMVQVYADWCRECHKLEQDMASHPDLSPLLRQRFVLVRLNLGSDAPVRFKGQQLSEKQLAQQLRATWPPMLLFYGHDGGLIGRRIGAASPAELRRMLDHVIAKAG